MAEGGKGTSGKNQMQETPRTVAVLTFESRELRLLVSSREV
jgi:hypothetical protein